MQIPTLVGVLDEPHLAADHLAAWGLTDAERARQTLQELADCGLTLDLLASLCGQLATHLPAAANPDEALAGLRRFLLASRSPLSVAALFERDPTALEMLLRVFALGPRWQALVTSDPEAFDLLRMTEGQPTARGDLAGEVAAEVAACGDERSAAAALGRIRRRETLRIAYGECYARQKFELVAEQLTFLAEGLVAAAWKFANTLSRTARPATHEKPSRPAPRVAVIALGRLGGAEMDYGDELDLLLVYDPLADDEPTRRAAREQLDRTARLLARLLGNSSESAAGYRLHFAPLPDAPTPAQAHTADDTVLGYDSFGRTWHRQELLRARPIAGDLPLGADVLRRLQPWIFRRYLSGADETGIQALRRRIIRRAEATATDGGADVARARGGLVDLEQGVQFLQLLFGGEQPAARPAGTLDAIAGLEQAAVLSPPERGALEKSYVRLRQVQHRLQTLLGPEVSRLPADPIQLRRLAESLAADAESLAAETRQALAQTWEVLRRFVETPAGDDAVPPIVDLLLDPSPDEHEIAAALAPFGFARPAEALRGLQDLATERVPFLSTRRSRHFLALIATRLLEQIAATPDPDGTLANLTRVSDSLGAKGVLWELFSFHPPSLHLYVRLCAASPYLSDILTTNPGMIDDLVDSLQLDTLPTLAELEAKLAELARGTDDPLPILRDLKNAGHLRIGVRDLLGQESIDATHAALADVAQLCVDHIARREFLRLVEKYGPPTIGPGPSEGEPCPGVILALGKLGGREPNYHSNVELAFLYAAEGTTRPQTRRQQRTANNHFFTQLAQRVLKEVSQLTPQGRLYPVELLLRPLGVGGAMALPLADFAQHFAGGAAPLWQWQALSQARPIFGSPAARDEVTRLLRQLLITRQPTAGEQVEIYRARLAQERGAAELNLKRGPGGTLDVETLAQALQLRQAPQSPDILRTGTLAALDALADAGHLSRDDAEYFAEAYRLLRRIESALRLLNTSARHDLPDDLPQLRRLALLLNHPHAESLRDRVIITLAENRRRFDRILRPA
ncbi:MAG: hypothetical protein SFU86_19595 [Pirellulaceae bacterium]|nr:hypothetical protein [Pirellulaceae bacterium]